MKSKLLSLVLFTVTILVFPSRSRAADVDRSSGKYTWADAFVKMNGTWKTVSGQVTAAAPERK